MLSYKIHPFLDCLSQFVAIIWSWTNMKWCIRTTCILILSPPSYFGLSQPHFFFSEYLFKSNHNFTHYLAIWCFLNFPRKIICHKTNEDIFSVLWKIEKMWEFASFIVSNGYPIGGTPKFLCEWQNYFVHQSNSQWINCMLMSLWQFWYYFYSFFL